MQDVMISYGVDIMRLWHTCGYNKLDFKVEVFATNEYFVITSLKNLSHCYIKEGIKLERFRCWGRLSLPVWKHVEEPWNKPHRRKENHRTMKEQNYIELK
jgi:hypothetical protein